MSLPVSVFYLIRPNLVLSDEGEKWVVKLDVRT